jgi:DNA polymerase III epsilon subunit-like protein
MGAGAVTAGWYADPWGLAPLRWWDGTQWTGHTTGPPPFEERRPALGHLVASGGRVAVIDVETTGLRAADRVIEVAVVTLDHHGTVVDEFEALINPGRDVGPVWLHRITASMVVGAPGFDEVAGQVAARLDGAVACAHNLPFDQRMLLGELTGCDISVDWGVGLDTLRPTGTKLEVACAEAGIELPGAHRALVDARATAQLLVAHADAIDHTPVPTRVGPHAVRPVRIVTRDTSVPVTVEVPFVAALAAAVHAEPDVAAYEQLLGVALADLRLTAEESAELAALASELGLDAGQVGRAHRDFLTQLIDAAVDDHVVTAEEYDELCRVAALLGIDVDVVDARTDGLRSQTATLALTAGLSVCFTGSAVDGRGVEIDRDELAAAARAAGLEPVPSVTKATGLLVAADPASRSGKAAKARRNGTPVASVGDFLAAIGTGDALPVTVLSSAGVALVCVDCGDSWLAGRRAATPRCAACKRGR